MKEYNCSGLGTGRANCYDLEGLVAVANHVEQGLRVRALGITNGFDRRYASTWSHWPKPSG